MNLGVRMRILLTLLLAVTLLVVTMGGVHLAAGEPPATAFDSTTADSLEAGASPETDTGSPAGEEEPASEAMESERAAPVFLGGKQIFQVRSTRNGLDPKARATAIRARLDAAVKDRNTPTDVDSVQMRRMPDGIEVRLGTRLLWFIAHGDVEGMSVPEIATMVSELPSRITDGILRERAGRSPGGILRASLLALGITIAAYILLRLLRNAGRRWRAFLDQTLPKHVRGMRLGGVEILSQARITGISRGILGRAGVVVGLALFYGYLTAVFSLFPWSQGWSRRLLDFAQDQVVAFGSAIARAIPGLLVLLGIFILFRWLIRISDRFFDSVDAGAVKVGWVHQELARPTKRLVRILLWVCAAAVAFPYIPGAESKAVQGISILLGVMVSLGSSGLVGNVIAGIVLTYSRSFSRGDRIRIGEHLGDVVNLGFFATKLRSPRNEEITLPNGQLASQPIINYTRLAREGGLVLHTQVTIGYDADWRRVHALLVEAAGRVEGIEPDPAPWVFQRSLNDYHITYEICCVTRESHQQLRLYSRLHEEIQDAFARAGVEILSPVYNALRDANAPVLPAEPPGPRAAPGGFRVRPAADA